MRKISWTICILAGLAWAESGPDLFQKALVAERADGKLEEAIKLYQRIAQKFPQDRSLTAKALLQLGQCYEKLGDAQARKAYDRVVREYGDQSNVALAARSGLGRLGGDAQAEGVKLRRVQVADGLEEIGGISPDGQYLSFVDGGHSVGELSILNLATGQKRQVTRGASRNKNAKEGAELSVFSPDGKQLAYGWHTPANSDQLRVINIDGSGVRTLFRTDRASWIQTLGWAGGKILIKSGDRDSNENHILVISAVDGAVRTLKTLRNPQPQVKLSPDGGWVAVNHRVAEVESLSLISTADGREVPLLEPTSDFRKVSGWTPDGKTLLYSARNNMQTNLYGLRLEDGRVVGEPILVRNNLSIDGPAGVTRQGSLYYTSYGHLSLNVFSAGIDPDTGKMQSEPALATSLSVGDNRWLSWSSDGSKMAYVTSMNVLQRERTIAILDETTGRVREIAPHLYPLHTLHWRPDGKALAALGPSPNGRQGVYSIDTRTGEATAIALSESPSATLLDPVFSPDGKSLLYRKAERDTVIIFLRNLSDGHTRELYRGASRRRSVVFSPDGTQLAFLADKSIMVQPLAGGEPRTILTLKEGEDFQGILGLGWMPNGKRLLFLKQPLKPSTGPVPVTVWSVGVEGGEAVSTGLVMPGITGISVHPSGRRIGFSASSWNPSNRAEMWVLEGFAKLP